ncbi:hypothetical protein ACQPX6_08115 [Actinomycetospora sp. CA-101289]|uniref:hypothetical protein n=1 Tax=Actinomycetospora sp. CA-101289 TaxID=3239893 RepID=UPI003D99EF65
MSDTDPRARPDRALPLHDLIQARMQERGWSYSDLERAAGRALTRGRWQQLGSGAPLRKFPDPGSLTVISQVLEVDITTVVLAAAQSLGLDVRQQGADLSSLLPDRTERLSDRMREAILALVRAAVAETLAEDGLEPARSDALRGLRLEWPKTAAPSGPPPTEDSPDDD